MYQVKNGTVEALKDELAETARREAEVRADQTRREVGEIVVDKVGEYFPEAVKKRRRRNIASGFVLGVLVGFFVRYVVDER